MNMDQEKSPQICYFEETAELRVPNEQGLCLDKKAPVQSCLLVYNITLEGNVLSKLFRIN